MKSFQQNLQQMHKLLDELIQCSKKLKDLSFQVISEEELDPLQKHQEELLLKIEALDQELHQHHSKEFTEKVHAELHQKLKTFQELNKAFIENLRTSHGLIQFELRRLKEEGIDEEKMSAFLHRYSQNIPSAPSKPEAVKPPKKKQDKSH